MRYIICIIPMFHVLLSFSQSEVQHFDGRKLTVAECLALSAQKEKTGDIKEATRYLNLAATLHWEKQEYHPALLYFEKSYEMNKSIGNENGMAMIAANLGMIFNDVKEYDKALTYLLYNLKIRRAYKEKNSIIASLINISIVLNNQGRYPESIQRLEEARVLATEQSDIKQMRLCYGMLSETYLKAGNQTKSKENYELYRTFHELEMRKRGNAADEAVENARLKTQLAEAEKRNKELQLFSTEKKLEESEAKAQGNDLEISQLLSTNTKQELASRVLKKETELKTLKTRQELEKAKAKADHDRFVQYLLIAGLLMMLILSGLLLYNYLQKRQKNIELAARNEEISLQKNEIARHNAEIGQRNEEITRQYKELAAARNTIEEQNLLLRGYNSRLEKQVEERTRQLMEVNEELIYQNNQLEQYAYVTAHNLRGPLARMIGLAYIFNHQDAADEINGTILEKVQKEVLQLDEVIRDLNQILDIRHKAGNNMELLDLNERIKFVAENFNEEIRTQEVQLTADVSAAQSVHFVKSYLDSILYNLVSNALKYRHPDRKPVIHIKSEYFSNDFICVSVADNGLGIDLKQHGHKIFGLYKRFHLHKEGKGLGLFLIKTQMESLGGRIKIQSQVNEGTILKLYFRIHHPGLNMQQTEKKPDYASSEDESFSKAL